MFLISQHVLIDIGVILVALAMILALQSRRTPQSAAAWILFIVLVPYVAVPVFLMLGFRKQRRPFAPIRLDRDRQDGDGTPEAARLFCDLGASAAFGGNDIRFQRTPAEAQAALDAVIDGAGRTIDVILYIVAADDSGRRFLARLTERAQAGVRVRVSLDWFGSLWRPRGALAELAAAGGEVRFFSPFLHPFSRGSLNLRNHRKAVIADGDVVWAGGRNVGDDYLASPARRWVDLSFTVTGPVARAFAGVFASDWLVAGGTPRAEEPLPRAGAAGQSVLQLVPAGPDEERDVLHDGLVSAIYRARRRIWIATPYFVPTEALALALATAARGGVDVRIYLPDRSNQRTADLARGAYLREATRAGCRVFRFMPGMMHAKVGVIDDLGWTGSANFDVRSMLLNFELALMAYDARSVAELEGWFGTIAPDCTEGLRRSPLPRRLVEGVFRLGAPIL